MRILVIILGIVLFWAAIGPTFGRHIHFYLVLVSLLILPICYWKQFHLKKIVLAVLIIATVFLAAPIDVGFRETGKFGVQILPASYGITCKPGAYCYGCIIPRYPPHSVIVVSF